ncbi:FAD-dependent thymidylate synthase [Promicromonospora sukumoe]|uniref:Flavin-dependent thymidylate synthase n=1 Tax=Promicromonospora sukumoe TaxID=88382 RepID=A0A7W3PCB8_9MICO|nr:FAD-dependent thymidylate synthase [Promicromonospora sukumoe]MBA8806382.1 thymidylate synthase (FAD) [Promicromonospora sukumoe]
MNTSEKSASISVRSDITAQLVRHSAQDSDVAFAARVSTLGDRSLDDVNSDAERSKGLINFLMRDRHGTPFEHNSMTFFISAPIFVFREFHRHRVGFSYNEESGRYRELEPVFYMPNEERNLVQEGRPGRYHFSPGTDDQHTVTRTALERSYVTAYEAYREMLDAGVAREVARSALPVGLYSSMYATCNARALMHFLSLRTTHAESTVPTFPQREIEMVAEAMEAQWAELMPLTHAAFNSNGRVAP